MKLNGKYRLLYASLGPLCSVTSGYNAYYLTEHGYAAGESGTLIALFGVVTALCLPMFGRIADRSRKFYWKNMLLTFVLLEMLVWTMLLAFDQKIVIGPLFQLTALMVSAMFPMINVACFYYENIGTPVDFGIARGIHSLFYAVGAYILGQLTASMGADVVPWIGLLLSAGMVVPILLMPYQGKEKIKKAQAPVERTENFWSKYPCFLVLVVGCALIMTVFSLTTTFLIYVVKDAGGDSSHMGTALTISALTEVPVMLLFSRIVKKISAPKLLIFSGIAYMFKCLVLFAAGNVWMIYGAQLLQPFSFAIFNLASVHFSGKYMEAGDAATGQTLLSMSSSAGSVAGSLAGGWLVAAVGVRPMLLTGGAVAVAATLVIAAAMRMYYKESKFQP